MNPEKIAEAFKAYTNEEEGNTQKQIDKLNNLMFVVVIVLIVMVATLIATVAGIVISTYQDQAASYQELQKTIDSQQYDRTELANF